MSNDNRLSLTDDETMDAELLADTLADSALAREQVAAEIVILRKLFAACRRDRQRLPLNARRIVERFPRYSHTVQFHLARLSGQLELEP